MKNKGTGKYFAIAIIILLVGALVYFTQYGKDGGKHGRPEAYVIAQHIVSQKLKNPGSAKFAPITDATISHKGDEYTVSAWVEAENSFGGRLRRYFIVTYTALPLGYTNPQAIIY